MIHCKDLLKTPAGVYFDSVLTILGEGKFAVLSQSLNSSYSVLNDSTMKRYLIDA